MGEKKEVKKNFAAMQDHYAETKNYFYDHHDLFDAIYDMLERKSAYGHFSIDYQGIHAYFAQEKDFVRMNSKPVQFTDEELRTLESFFEGYDYDRLEMLRIDQDSRFTMFNKGNYENGRYKILIVPAQPQNIYSCQALHAEYLDENWVVIQSCESPREQHVFIWERDAGGKIILGSPPYPVAP